MLLITEVNDNVNLITEGTDGSKEYHIEGIFMEADKKNRNGRVYPQKILFNEVKRYNEDFVSKNRGMGELGHPDGPTYGKIVKNLIDEGVKIGVSSRGMGSLKNVDGVNEVQDDFMLAAVDIVADPSAPNAFVEGVMEGTEWVWNNGVLEPRHIESYRDRIQKASTRSEIQEAKLYAFADFLSKLI